MKKLARFKVILKRPTWAIWWVP